MEVNRIRFFMAFLLRGMGEQARCPRAARAAARRGARNTKDEREANRFHPASEARRCALRTWTGAPEQVRLARLSGVFYRECVRRRPPVARGKFIAPDSPLSPRVTKSVERDDRPWPVRCERGAPWRRRAPECDRRAAASEAFRSDNLGTENTTHHTAQLMVAPTQAVAIAWSRPQG